MIKRNRFPKDFKEKVVMELISGQSSVAQVAQREGIHPQTLRNWKKEIGDRDFESSNESELALRKRIAELEGALAEASLDIYILKKAQKYLKEYQRQEKLSGSISRQNSES